VYIADRALQGLSGKISENNECVLANRIRSPLWKNYWSALIGQKSAVIHAPKTVSANGKKKKS
jgi:hypothetical protein